MLNFLEEDVYMLNLDTSFFNYMVSDDSNLSPTRKYERNQFRNRINGYAESFRRQNGFKELQHEYGKFARLARKLINEEGLVSQNKNEVNMMLKDLAHAMQSYRQSPNEYDYKIPCGKTQGFNLGMIARHRLSLRLHIDNIQHD